MYVSILILYKRQTEVRVYLMIHDMYVFVYMQVCMCLRIKNYVRGCTKM